MKKLYLSFCVLLAAVLCLPAASQAQLTLVPAATAATLANKLVGSGVVVYGATLTCAGIANATFTGTSTLPFDSGIVLTSGRAQTLGATWGCNGAASNFATTANGTPGDPMLTALAGQPTFDACILEFNFRPAGDTVKFNYVFGSEEYPEWACSSFNDVFGFFITGPGYGAPTNLALVPGTTIPVSINSVNSAPVGTGFGIATCNAMGPGAPFGVYYVNNSTSATIVYDGTTTLLQAVAPVTPCDTYHLKIGIADGTDQSYDSGVFLEAGSLSSTGISITPLGMNPGDTIVGGEYCVRGCLPGKFVFSRSGTTALPFVIHYVIGGTAVNGYDYATIADSVVIPASDTSVTLTITPLLVPPTGPKIVKLYILSPYSCGGAPTVIDSAQMIILDSFYVHINTSDTAICIGQYVNISTTADPLLSYSWTPSATLSSATALNPTATPTTTTTYLLTGTFPGGGCAPSTDKITITVYTPPAISVGPFLKKICKGVPLQLAVVPVPAASYLTYSWTPATDLSNAAIPNPVVTPGTVGDFMYYVTVGTPVAGCNSRDSFMLHVLPDDFTLLSPDTAVCYPPGIYDIRAIGDPEFSYAWLPSYSVVDPYSLITQVRPDVTTTYTITGSFPGCPDMVHTILYSIQHPQVDIVTGDTTVCLEIPMPLDVVVTPADSPYTFSWSPVAGLVDPLVIEPFFFDKNPGYHTYYVTIQSQLGCTETDSIIIRTAPLVNIIATPPKSFIKLGEEVQIEAINLGVDPLMYTWTPNDGSLTDDDINNPIARPQETTVYSVRAMNEWGCIDTATLIINVDESMAECIPSAFTPNGDGLNDVFRLLCNKYQKLVDFKVYNRWGEVIYTNSTDPKKGWDGTFNGVPQDMGVYHYVLIVGRPGQLDVMYKGDVTLIR
ncbi:MAG: choice-of-anchor L domain-containing protein [Bacteroidota bacterium]